MPKHKKKFSNLEFLEDHANIINKFKFKKLK